ncbi:hypothetical protein ACFVTE_16195 [Arthrobacter sp. NPDC058097]|uniref:hypothetical protein n=1 Tax=Arthrobacter sp. NPDC058097 TaxID=3346340 RepID=UPI0036DE7317
MSVVQDWARLEAGDRVVVIDDGVESPAIVAAKMDDSTVVWVLGAAGRHRRAIDYREGVVLVPT